MCGIVGYIGTQEAAPILLQGLRRLEYRGYDSAGLATLSGPGQFHIAKLAGRVDKLAGLLAHRPCPGTIGIAHTRWATHGPPSDANAHPHLGGEGEVLVVHNGVIENYAALRHRLEAQGFPFRSATDTEAIAHLLAAELRRESFPDFLGPNDIARLAQLFLHVLGQLRGTYGLAILLPRWPDVLIAARLGSPVLLGIGDGAYFIASDPAALAGQADKVVYLADHELAVLTRDSFLVCHRDTGPTQVACRPLDIDVRDIELGNFAHYMLKEIFEQPEAIRNCMRGRLDKDTATARFGGLNLSPRQLRRVDRIIMTGCGTSWHAGLVAEYQIETLARLAVEVEYASELRYRNPPVGPNTLLFAITQSGETADTLAALREMKRKGNPTLAICNVVGSSIAREADGGIYLHAGPEIGVASTKAFACQCTVTAMLALYFGRLHHLGFDEGLEIISQLESLPQKVEAALEVDAQVRRIAEKYAHCSNFLYLGRHINFPTALEGALKLKEISYIHAEGYPAAEMKHGPIALVDKNTPSVFIIPQGPVYDKILANMQEIRARGGPIIALVNYGDQEAAKLADDVLYLPPAPFYLQPIIFVVPLQLLAYHIAVLRGCDVDKPRNLAKSVTVE
ncbi:MAG: glutamine--fructose-6-phosphate transaminase (isomerizing) [Thermoguttaceae bacterium]|nr:glutamine--fructose-6-phosphate transaminase (isomerizing) [Thermoguttaceae bacterium]MDW8079956.1 glutamine--fructose-6-phosphate transaminase (isomerizing) [Thermoguttaceae bacterium]